MPKAFSAARTGAVLLTALCFVVAALSGPARAEGDYPSRTIRVVTPFAAGAASDIALRILAEKMSTRLNVPVVVQNQPGGGGVIASRTVTNAPADGYTIAWVGNNTAIGVSLFNEPFDPRADMRPIVGVSEFAYLFVTGASSPYKTLADWMNAARQKPGKLSVGTSSAGTSNHLTALLFKSAQKLDFTVVPYRGPAELSVALLRNDVDLVVNAYGGLRAAIDARQIRPFAATSPARLPELPDVPTMKEAGVDDFVVSSWNGLYGPKDMPEQAVEALARAATESLAQSDTKAQFKEIGFEARALPADAQDKLMRTEIDRWAKVIADAGISKQ
jgi:tripartite-type tricarboxylate transporter receptor subunit TctC